MKANHTEAMKLALETLEGWKGYMPALWDKTDEQAITALREALAEPPAQPYKGIADHINQAANGRMRIDPVTGDVGIGTPSPQPAPEQGWKLVPVEPTAEMWKAVNKLDDECAAGNYDGKGCSIEQAWNCLLAAAPQPAQQEPVGEVARYDRIHWYDAGTHIPTGTKLYTHPQAREPLEYWNAVEGWVKIDEVREHFDSVGCGTIYKTAGEGREPLYTTPPQRTWVGLTNDEVNEFAAGCHLGNSVQGAIYKAVAKLKEKNT